MKQTRCETVCLDSKMRCWEMWPTKDLWMGKYIWSRCGSLRVVTTNAPRQGTVLLIVTPCSTVLCTWYGGRKRKDKKKSHTYRAHPKSDHWNWSHQIYMSVLIQDVQIKPNVSYFYEMRCVFWASGVDPTRSAISVFNSKVYALHLFNLIFFWLSRYRPRFAMSL